MLKEWVVRARDLLLMISASDSFHREFPIVEDQRIILRALNLCKKYLVEKYNREKD